MESVTAKQREIKKIARLASELAPRLFAVVLPVVVICPSVSQTVASSSQSQTSSVPTSWVDADNGYKIVRLTNEPGSKALDSRRNAFTADGQDMVYLSPRGLHLLNLQTQKSRFLLSGRIESLAVGTKTRQLYVSRGSDTSLYALDIDKKTMTKIADLPPLGEVLSVNSDETTLVGKGIEPGHPSYKDYLLKARQELTQEQTVDPNLQLTDDKIKERAMKLRADARTPEQLFTVDIKTGKVNTILQTTDWIGYVQFSPTDPTLLMYAHEGMYYEADRIWTIRSDGSQNQQLHQRTQRDESATREFWSRDGKTIWYEWQKPRGKSYAMVGYDIATGNRTLLKMEKREASISYNVAKGDSVFCGSGHRAVSAKDGSIRGGKQSIELLYPVFLDQKMMGDPNLTSLFKFDDAIGTTYPDSKYVGWFRRVTIANMFKTDYNKLEPNIRFTPDDKKVIFTSNMFGPTYIFAVELNSN